MHRVGAAEQVVQIAHHLLISPSEKDAYSIGLAIAQGV